MLKINVEAYQRLQEQLAQVAQEMAETIIGPANRSHMSGSLYRHGGDFFFSAWDGSRHVDVVAPAEVLWDLQARADFCAAYECEADKKEREEFQRLREKYCGNPCDD